MRPAMVAKNYTASWCFVDVFIVLVDWLDFFVSSLDGFASVRVVKTARAFRVLRVMQLLRVLKLPILMQNIIARFYSEKLVLYLSIFNITFVFLCVVCFISIVSFIYLYFFSFHFHFHLSFVIFPKMCARSVAFSNK